MARETIKTWSGIILGYVDTEPNGDAVAKAFDGRILGYYKKSNNMTTDFSGKFLYQGNCVTALIVNNGK